MQAVRLHDRKGFMDADTRISGSTRLVGLIGSPVTYSGSPAVHNAVFEKMGYDFAFVPFDVKPENLEAAVRGMEALGFLGYNVTAPYKSAVVPYLHEISRVAEIMGAVNIVVVQNGRSLGDNADGAAFMRNLVLNGVNVRGKKITVLGAGGAACAIAVQAALDGVAEIDVFNRQEKYQQSGYELVERLHSYSECAISLYSLSDMERLRASVAESALVVNATSVGYPDDPGCLLDADMLRPELIVSDLVYNPRETELIKLARSQGCKTVDGAGFFVQQAAIAERLWFGREMPVDFVMETFFEE